MIKYFHSNLHFKYMKNFSNILFDWQEIQGCSWPANLTVLSEKMNAAELYHPIFLTL